MIGKNEMFRKTVVGEGIFPNRIVHVRNKKSGDRAVRTKQASKTVLILP